MWSAYIYLFLKSSIQSISSRTLDHRCRWWILSTTPRVFSDFHSIIHHSRLWQHTGTKGRWSIIQEFFAYAIIRRNHFPFVPVCCHELAMAPRVGRSFGNRTKLRFIIQGYLSFFFFLCVCVCVCVCVQTIGFDALVPGSETESKCFHCHRFV